MTAVLWSRPLTPNGSCQLLLGVCTGVGIRVTSFALDTFLLNSDKY